MNLRKFTLENPELSRQIALTDSQRSIINLVKCNSQMMSSELSIIKMISIQSASATLRDLYCKGYLVREEVKQESGGVEYIYKPSEDIL